ncbi:hypothetical protein ACTNEW_07680 [Blautia sp. HCP3S3_G3]|uniref:hypothetical protein n=1 Tax=Blautia sp. HCP3S3_G3 TaxID=3438913 RepID=UPI003F8B7BA8
MTIQKKDDKLIIKSKALFSNIILMVILSLAICYFLYNCFPDGRNIDVSDMLAFIILSITLLIIDTMYIYSLVFAEMRVLTMDADGCMVSWLGFKKRHRWSEFEIIREDRWGIGKWGYHGIVFSTKLKKRNGKIYSAKDIFLSFNFWNCFAVIWSRADWTSVSFTDSNRKRILEQMEEWGIKVTRTEEIAKEEYYKTMVEARKKTRDVRKKKEKE